MRLDGRVRPGTTQIGPVGALHASRAQAEGKEQRGRRTQANPSGGKAKGKEDSWEDSTVDRQNMEGFGHLSASHSEGMTGARVHGGGGG